MMHDYLTTTSIPMFFYDGETKMGEKQQIGDPTRYKHPVRQEPKVLEID
jgi:hypothetical protein